MGPLASPANSSEEDRVPEATGRAEQPPLLAITYEGNDEEDLGAKIRAIKGTFLKNLNFLWNKYYVLHILVLLSI